MVLSAALRRLACWLALVATLSGAIIPALGQAMQAGSGSGRVAVCTATGSKWVALTEAPAQAPADSDPAAASAHKDHCALCSQSGAAVMLPATFGTLTSPSPTAFGLPDTAAAAPTTRDRWGTGSPRGPPLHA